MPRSRLAALPADEACRGLALARLAEAGAAAWRLSDPDDAEALHDFRVALRRLRALLRAFAAPLAGRLGKRWPRRLARLAEATGEGRDAEVALAWVESERPTLPPGQRPGASWLAGRLAARTEAAYAGVRGDVQARFAPLAERLRLRLSPEEKSEREDPGEEDEAAAEGSGATQPVVTAEGSPAAESPGSVRKAEDEGPPVEPTVRPSRSLPSSFSSSPPPFGLVLAEALREHSSRLGERLREISSHEDVEPAHRARIAGKRLRYLLETVAGEVAGAALAVRRLKRLQDLLGELHDAHVLAAELPAAAERAAAETARALAGAATAGNLPKRRRWTAVAGVLGLVERNRARRDRLFAELAAGWLRDGHEADRLAEAVEAVASRLAARAAEPVRRSRPGSAGPGRRPPAPESAA